MILGFHRGYMLILRNDSNKILTFNKFSMLCGTTAIHFDQLVFALFENTFSYITNPSKLIAPLISVTRLKLNKSVEQFHRGYILQDFFGEVNSFFQKILRVLEVHPQPFHQLIVYNVRSLKEPIHCQTLPNITFRQNPRTNKCCHDVPLINSYLYSEY